MGIFSSGVIKREQPAPEKLSDFKNLAVAPEQYAIPEIPQKRVPTDKVFSVVFVICNIILFMFLTYSFLQCDELRQENGYDTCGNVCGEKNDYVDGLNCSGKDYTNSPHLRYKESIPFGLTGSERDAFLYFQDRECVEKCEKTDSERNNRCIPQNDLESDDVDDTEIFVYADAQKSDHNTSGKLESVADSFGFLILSIVIAIGFVLATLAALRYTTAGVVWTMTIGSYILLVILTISVWFADSDEDQNHVFLIVTLTIITIIVTIILIIHFKRIPLVINLMAEAMKAIFTMPALFLHAFLAFISVFIGSVFLILTLVQLFRAGVLTKFGDVYIYDHNFGITFTIFFDIVIFIWIVEFVHGCHIMVISGSVSTWYFTRDKTFLGSPVKDSFMNVIKYHLGSVALGSLILTAIAILRALLENLTRNRRTAWLVKCCMGYVETVIDYITKNAYIQVAMHGENFTKSGKRAVQLLYWNLNDVIALNFIRNTVLIMLKLAVALCTVVVMICVNPSESESYILIVTLGGLFAFVLAHTVFETVAIAIDTIFLCYCEDWAINDGLERPYYMTTDLMIFFDESKKVVGGPENAINKPVECEDV